MKNLVQYYGTETPSTLSYLEFGSIDTGSQKKEIWGFTLHQQAYDWFMLARYANELAAFVDLAAELDRLDWDQVRARLATDIHHRNTLSVALLLLCGLAAAGRERPSFLELGQTIFGWIEAMQFTRALLARAGVPLDGPDLAAVSWRGVDISGLFNTLSRVLHQGYAVQTDTDPARLPERSDLFFAKGVTLLYAVRSAEELLQMAGRGDVALFDYSFTHGPDRASTIGTGKTVFHLGLDRFLDLHRASGRALWVAEEKGFHPAGSDLVFLNCLSGPEDALRRMLEAEARVRAGLRASGLDDLFVPLRPGGLDWMPAEQWRSGAKA